MKLILTEDIATLGPIGSQVNVKAGYARNFLLPRGYAVIASSSNQKELNQRTKALETKRAKAQASAEALAAQIAKASVTIKKQVGEDERIFGSVTTAEVADALKAHGIEVPRRDIRFVEEVRKVGVHEAEARIHSGVTAKIKVWVVDQENKAPRQEAAATETAAEEVSAEAAEA